VEVRVRAVRRRSWSAEDKLRIVRETLEPGAVAKAVADRHGISTGLLFTWRKETLAAAMSGFVPVEVVPEVPKLEAPPTVPAAPAAPGTIEVSALAGNLVDLSGRLTTNLRIRCAQDVDVTAVGGSIDPGGNLTINLNTCRGVRFGVLGTGVGIVELRARYEPSSAASAAGILEREAAGNVAFVAPTVNLSLNLNPNPVAVGQTGVATLRFNRVTTLGDVLLINPQTGLPIAVNLGTTLNGNVTFTSSNPGVASFTGIGAPGTSLVTTTTGTASGGAGTIATSGVIGSTSGSVTVGCGTLPTASFPNNPATGAGLLGDFFGGCDQVQANYIGNAVGSTVITATFAPLLPGAFGGPGATAGAAQAVFGFFGSTGQNAVSQTLAVVGVGPATTQRLVPGCNNVVAPANETVAQVAARVDPATAVVSIWKQVPGTVQFQGAPVGGNVPAGVANLSSVNALDAIFICVTAAATYRLS